MRAPAEGKRSGPAFRFVVLLGTVSLLADFTYEGARSSTGPFLATLGASALVVGAVAGGGEFLGYSVRFLSGRLTDRLGSYWPIAIAGYCVNLLAVPALALAGSVPLAALLILLERTGKAIRNPARDAMLSHAAHSVGRGWAYGFHEAMDQLGATIGPLVLAAVLFVHESYRVGFALLIVPALAAIATLFLARRAFARPQDLEPVAPRFQRRGFPAKYWWLVACGALAGAGFADFALISYRAAQAHLVASYWIAVLYALANAVSAAAAIGWGWAADRWGTWVLPSSLAIAAVAAPFLFVGGAPSLVLGLVLWGIGLGAIETLFKAAIAGFADRSLRASAFGTFDGVFGVAWFLGSAVLGYLFGYAPEDAAVASFVLLGASIPVGYVAARAVERDRRTRNPPAVAR